MPRGPFSFFFALAALVVACSAAPAKPERLCTPHANVYCRCVDREEGTKRCNEDGQSFQECLPCDGSGRRPVELSGEDGLGARPGSVYRGEEETSEDRDASTDDDGRQETRGADGGTTAPTGADAPPALESDAGTAASTGTDGAMQFPDEIHCKPLENIAPRIELQKLADVPTPPVGGDVAPGLYVQSWVIEFTGEEGAAGPSQRYSRETLEIGEDVGRFVFEDDDGTKVAGGFRLTPRGTAKVEVAYECPAAPPKELAYDATESTLILYDPPLARVFVRQKESH